jgi:8-oxo-dGTP diphosphatase
MTDPSAPHVGLPYRIAVLCYLYDRHDRLLLLHRAKAPNKGMYSPIGGKLELDEGEGPHDCARREVQEETGIRLDPKHIRLNGIVSECAYEGETHWLIYLFEVTRPVDPEEVHWTDFDEGTLEWVALDDVESLPIPQTDRHIMFPLVREHRGGFFMVHIDCSVQPMTWRVCESWPADVAPESHKHPAYGVLRTVNRP